MCDSSPHSRICERFRSSFTASNAEKLILARGENGPMASRTDATVCPNFSGFCSLAIMGISKRRAIVQSMIKLRSTRWASHISGKSRVCTSTMSSAHWVRFKRGNMKGSLTPNEFAATRRSRPSATDPRPRFCSVAANSFAGDLAAPELFRVLLDEFAHWKRHFTTRFCHSNSDLPNSRAFSRFCFSAPVSKQRFSGFPS